MTNSKVFHCAPVSPICHEYMTLCLSVTSQCSIETLEHIKLVFGTEATLSLSNTAALWGNSHIPKIRELPPGTLFQTLNSRFSCFVATARRQLQVFSISSTVASSSHWAGRPSSFMLILHYFDLLWICCGRRPVGRRRLRLVLIMPDCRMFLLTRWTTDRVTTQRLSESSFQHVFRILLFPPFGLRARIHSNIQLAGEWHMQEIGPLCSQPAGIFFVAGRNWH